MLRAEIPIFHQLYWHNGEEGNVYHRGELTEKAKSLTTWGEIFSSESGKVQLLDIAKNDIEKVCALIVLCIPNVPHRCLKRRVPMSFTAAHQENSLLHALVFYQHTEWYISYCCQLLRKMWSVFRTPLSRSGEQRWGSLPNAHSPLVVPHSSYPFPAPSWIATSPKLHLSFLQRKLLASTFCLSASTSWVSPSHLWMDAGDSIRHQ